MGPIHWLENDKILVGVAPEVGRIVWFSPRAFASKSPNLLWEYPRPVEDADKFGGWKNYGGDKVWYAPQKAWDWPPPTALDPGPYKVSLATRTRLKMTSPIDSKSGLRVTRIIALDASAPMIAITSTLERVQPGEPKQVAAWEIAQVLPPQTLLARSTGEQRAITPMLDNAPEKLPTTKPAAGRWMEVDPVFRGGKIGFPADALAVRHGDDFWVLRRINSESDYAPQDYATSTQIYADDAAATGRAPGSGPYVELEFVSPLRLLAVGQSVSLHMQWSLAAATPKGVPAER